MTPKFNTIICVLETVLLLIFYLLLINNLSILQKVLNYQFACGKVFNLEQTFKLTNLSCDRGVALDEQIKSLTEDLINESAKVDDQLLIQFLRSLKSDQEQGLGGIDYVKDDASSGSSTGQENAAVREHHEAKKTSEAVSEAVSEAASEAKRDESESSIEEQFFITQLKNITRHEKL